MNISLDDFVNQYVLCDGFVHSISLHYSTEPSSIQVILRIRRYQSKTRHQWHYASLLFSEIQEFYINGDKGINTSAYSDIVFCSMENGEIYLSLDPYGNSGQPHPEDNDVILAMNVAISVNEINEKSNISSRWKTLVEDIEENPICFGNYE